jgi:hypothetical protein
MWIVHIHTLQLIDPISIKRRYTLTSKPNLLKPFDFVSTTYLHGKTTYMPCSMMMMLYNGFYFLGNLYYMPISLMYDTTITVLILLLVQKTFKYTCVYIGTHVCTCYVGFLRKVREVVPVG